MIAFIVGFAVMYFTKSWIITIGAVCLYGACSGTLESI